MRAGDLDHELLGMRLGRQPLIEPLERVVWVLRKNINESRNIVTVWLSIPVAVHLILGAVAEVQTVDKLHDVSASRNAALIDISRQEAHVNERIHIVDQGSPLTSRDRSVEVDSYAISDQIVNAVYGRRVHRSCLFDSETGFVDGIRAVKPNDE